MCETVNHAKFQSSTLLSFYSVLNLQCCFFFFFLQNAEQAPRWKTYNDVGLNKNCANHFLWLYQIKLEAQIKLKLTFTATSIWSKLATMKKKKKHNASMSWNNHINSRINNKTRAQLKPSKIKRKIQGQENCSARIKFISSPISISDKIG